MLSDHYQSNLIKPQHAYIHLLQRNTLKPCQIKSWLIALGFSTKICNFFCDLSELIHSQMVEIDSVGCGYSPLADPDRNALNVTVT